MTGFIVLVLSWAASVLPLQAIEPTPQRYGDAISKVDLKDNLSILASDAMEGRETGTRGQKMAAAFIRAHFESIGLIGPVNDDYYQPIELYTRTSGDTYVRNGDIRYDNFTDIVYTGGDDSDGEISLPLVFVGNGQLSDFDQLVVKGKAVLLFSNNESVSGNREIALAQERGSRMIFVCNINSSDPFERQVERIKQRRTTRDLSLEIPAAEQRQGVFFVSPQVVGSLAGVALDRLKAAAAATNKKSLKKLKPATIVYKSATAVKVVKSENVLGYLEGTDKKDEIVIITAHYDHIGIRKNGTGDRINNGADDDGSGTVAVMELARVFAQARKDGHGPRRSMLFMTVTGEEKGLLGSLYYTQHPVFPLQQTVVDLNIDMVGRRDALHKDSAPYVYVIGADKLSTELNTISESENNAYTKLIFDYTYNDQRHPERLYYRSDHWNFAKHNIPIIFYFDGIHEDYHRPGDEVDKIEFDLLAKRTQCVFYTAWEIANRDQRILPDKKP